MWIRSALQANPFRTNTGWEERRRLAPPSFFVALLASMAADFADAHAVNADALQGFFHFVQLKRLNDRFDFLHTPRPLPLEQITFFSMKADIETLDFLFLGDTHAD